MLLSSRPPRPSRGRKPSWSARFATWPARPRKQPGCVQFTLLRVANDRSTIIGYERWASEVEHQQHLKGVHVQQLMSRMAEIIAGPPSIISYEAIDE